MFREFCLLKTLWLKGTVLNRLNANAWQSETFTEFSPKAIFCFFLGDEISERGHSYLSTLRTIRRKANSKYSLYKFPLKASFCQANLKISQAR